MLVITGSGLHATLQYDGTTHSLTRVSGANHLPGQPQAELKQPELADHLRKSLAVTGLDEIAKHLWWVSTPSSGRVPTIRTDPAAAQIATPHHAHISPLHHQAVRGRIIVLAEDPHLHLVWYYDRIFIKPIPQYLLSEPFWEFLEAQDQDLWKAAVGFMRSYAYLIQYETDFKLAQDKLDLIPTKNGTNPITFEDFWKFIKPFKDAGDGLVAPRYQYGELRLTRLNMMMRVLFKKLTFHHINAQWDTYLGKFVAPFLTAFVVLTTVLTAMQVELAIQALSGQSGVWLKFSQASRWFSVTVIIMVAFAIFCVLVLVAFMAIHDHLFARKIIRAKKKSVSSAANLKSGVV